ncbi:MFS transporter [Halosolutus halophilus]|uniref:MFS transporter n=1 Tax=Halosolutus halophilus TaxID=1552990 RepID=UPI003CE4E6C7
MTELQVLSIPEILLTVLFAAYAVGQFPSGILTDRVGEQTTLVVSLVTTSIAIVVLLSGEPRALLLGVTGVFGFGAGLYAIARFTVLGRVYTDAFGTAGCHTSYLSHRYVRHISTHPLTGQRAIEKLNRFITDG